MHLLLAVRLAFRSIVRRPVYAAVVIVILGLGIGANAAIFALVDAVLVRSLPYDHPEALVVVFADGSARGQGSRIATTPGDWIDWRAGADSVFAGLAAVRNISPRITSLDQPVVPLTHAVTANYFTVLGATPLLGRAFRAGEDAPGHDDVVMLSYALWQAKFGGRPDVVGRTIDLDNRPHTVIGVMGADFYSAHIFNVQPDLWVPVAFDAERADRSTRDLIVYGRLAATGTIESAQAAMRVVAARVAREHPDTDDRWSISLVPLREHVVGGFTRVAALVLAAVGLVLLIACANVANLALARGVERTGDVAVRVALGASRPRIMIELLTESVVLAAAGGVVGIVIATAAIPALVHLIPTGAGVPFLHRAAVDGRLLAFTVVVAIASAALAGILPARQAGRLDVIDGLRPAVGGTMPAVRRWRDALVAAEIALAIVIVMCAALMARTLSGLERAPTGFRAERIAKLRTSLRGDAFDRASARVAHFEELQRRLASITGVAAVSAVSFEPPMPSAQVAAVRLKLAGDSDDSAAPRSAVSRAVLAGYFETMGIPILSGRGVSSADRADTQRIAVISATMARRFFAGVDPIGRTFAVDGPNADPLIIVGVAGDVFTAGNDPAPVPAFYVPYTQNAVPVMTMVMRVDNGDVAAPLRQAERIAWSLSPFTNVYGIGTMERQLTELNWRPRFAAAVLGGFALVGLLLAAAGLYAVVSYTVVQRRRELGLRMALGAASGTVVADVLRDALRTVVVGIAVGDIGALVCARALGGMLYGVEPRDPGTLAVVSLSMFVVALAGCLAPAISAARLDPLKAIRSM